MPLTNGQIFAGYKIVRLLGAGGMGEVYLGQHPRLPRRDALKLLPHDWSADEEYRARFNREADLASTLWHPHIVGVHDRGEEDGQLWISMDFVDGLDAARLSADRYPAGMPVEEVARIVTGVASALDYAHKQGLLHRDVKPANIMLTHLDDEGEQRILLTDFGIARNVNDISGLTKTNTTIGTVAYAAPEQLLGEEEVDGRADQYSLAATAFHLLTGSQLFPHSNPAVVISRHLNLSPPLLTDHRPELAVLDPVFAKGLAKRPEDRFNRCSEFAQALSEQALTPTSPYPLTVTKPAPVQSNPAPTLPKSPAPNTDSDGRANNGGRKRWPLLAGALAIVLAGVIAVAWRPWTTTKSSGSASSPSASPPGASPASLTIATAAVPAVIDVDPTDYQDRESPGYYTWTYTRTPSYRECGIFPSSDKSTVPEGVSCEVDFPPGTPEVSNGSWSGPPNSVKIVPPDGPTGWLSEGGQSGKVAITLLPNHRITVGPFSCTALSGGGIDCQGPSGGFRFADGVLTKRGAR